MEVGYAPRLAYLCASVIQCTKLYNHSPHDEAEKTRESHKEGREIKAKNSRNSCSEEPRPRP